MLFAVPKQLFLLVRMLTQFSVEQLQTLIELRFEILNSPPLLVECGLSLGTPFFQAERNGRVPLIGGDDIQSLVVHGSCALSVNCWGSAWGNGAGSALLLPNRHTEASRRQRPHCNRGGSR